MYYSANRYLTQSEMETNASFIKGYLLPRGWTLNAIAGLLGNTQTESTINPALWENLDPTNINGGYGLVQWTPSTKFTDWCTQNNQNPADMESNLNRIIYEVENNIQWGNDTQGNPPPFTFQAFTKSTLDPYTLGMYFLRYYERPLNPDQPIRGTQAIQWYNYLGGLPVKKKGKAYLYVTRKRRYFI